MNNHLEVVDLMRENEELRAALDSVWRMAIRYPFPQVCKHLIACRVLSTMEEIGFEIPASLARAVVTCDDETALAWGPLRKKGDL
jgi:hypothetical protein